ncbi:MAG TPA: PGPGW domain-containing protein [Gemmatimonadaceae bacterium]|nr:PGPGW domain-containing protein [Gemmatimonadaceae bacterium]
MESTNTTWNAGNLGGARRTGVLRTARKVVVAVVGTAVLIAGVALLVLPGPAFVVIPAGLAILATEFVWARRLLRYAKDRALRVVRRRGAARPVQGVATGEESRMRVVHLARADDRPHAEAECGNWGSMDTDWTDVESGVTCPACRALIRTPSAPGKVLEPAARSTTSTGPAFET